MSEELNLLIGLYFSSSLSSIIMNTYLNQSSHYYAKKESMRKLKYKDDLNYKSKRELRVINYNHLFDMVDGILNSLLPIKNIFYTLDNIYFKEDIKNITENVYDEIVENANKAEDDYRKTNVDMLRSIRSELINIPESIDLEDQRIRLNKKETKKILKLNKLNYDVEMLKYEKENNIL